MHLRVTETAEASLAEAVAEASNKATVVVLRYMAWQRYHFHWAKHNGSGEFIGRYRNIKKITIKNPKKVMKKSQSYTLKLQVTYTKGVHKTYRKISYESSNNKVVSISQSRKLKALSKGKATITIYGQNGIYTTMNVTVK